MSFHTMELSLRYYVGNIGFLIVIPFLFSQSELWGKHNILVSGGSDGENRDCLVSFSIVPVESGAHYEWHMANEQKHVELRDNFLRVPLLVVPTDRKRGLINATSKMLPDCAPRHCARHLIGNLPSQLTTATQDSKGTFWSIVYAEAEPLFKRNMNCLKEQQPSNHAYLEKNKPYEVWADYCFPTFTWNERTNNLSEHAVHWFGEDVRTKSAIVICRLITDKLAVRNAKLHAEDLERQKEVRSLVGCFSIVVIVVVIYSEHTFQICGGHLCGAPRQSSFVQCDSLSERYLK